MATSEVVSRPVRTVPQLATAIMLTEFIDQLIYDFSDTQYGAVVGLLSVVLVFIMVSIEEGFKKGFLRTIGSGDASWE